MAKYEVRQVDGYMDEENGWVWNMSIHIGEFSTNAENTKRAFTNYLRKLGIVFKSNRTLITDYMDVIEIIDRKTKEPLFAALLLM